MGSVMSPCSAQAGFASQWLLYAVSPSIEMSAVHPVSWQIDLDFQFRPAVGKGLRPCVTQEARQAFPLGVHSFSQEEPLLVLGRTLHARPGWWRSPAQDWVFFMHLG